MSKMGLAAKKRNSSLVFVPSALFRGYCKPGRRLIFSPRQGWPNERRLAVNCGKSHLKNFHQSTTMTDGAKQFLSEHRLVSRQLLQKLYPGRRYHGVAGRLVRLDRKATQTAFDLTLIRSQSDLIKPIQS
jgi:hypothetical protein